MRVIPQGLVVCLLALAACTAPGPKNEISESTLTTWADASFMTLGPSDVVRVDVLGHPELSTRPDGTRVDPQGGIHLPVVGRVALGGKTIDEVNRTLNAAFLAYMREPIVTATVLEYGSRQFHLLGNIELPGLKTIDRPLNLLEALAQGGQFLRGADRDSVFLLRPHSDRLEVHEFNAATPGPDGLVQIRHGDIVFVRQLGTQDFQEHLLPILAGLATPFTLNALAPLYD